MPATMSAAKRNRVLIRPPTPADCAAFIAAVRRSYPLHRRWINPKAKTPTTYKKYMQCGPNAHRLVVVLKATGDIVGVINLNDVIRGNFQSASVGYYAFLPYSGQGLMGEGLELVLRHAFKKLKLHRVEANIQADNRASLRLAKKCGFVKEGFARRMVKVCGRWKDHERWAILAENFRELPPAASKTCKSAQTR